jgi:hypothetical protein
LRKRVLHGLCLSDGLRNKFLQASAGVDGQALADAKNLEEMGMLTGLQVCEDLAHTIILKSKGNDVAQLSGDDAIVRYSALYGEKIADALSGRRLFGRTRRDTDKKATNIFSYDTVINLLQDQCATMTQDKALAFVMARHKR